MEIRDINLVKSPDGLRTVSCTANASMSHCGALHVDFDLSGNAPSACLELEFERATCVLDFFPDGSGCFHVGPTRSTTLVLKPSAFPARWLNGFGHEQGTLPSDPCPTTGSIVTISQGAIRALRAHSVWQASSQRCGQPSA